jgi:hypothetical protein
MYRRVHRWSQSCNSEWLEGLRGLRLPIHGAVNVIETRNDYADRCWLRAHLRAEDRRNRVLLGPKESAWGAERGRFRPRIRHPGLLPQQRTFPSLAVRAQLKLNPTATALLSASGLIRLRRCVHGIPAQDSGAATTPLRPPRASPKQSTAPSASSAHVRKAAGAISFSANGATSVGVALHDWLYAGEQLISSCRRRSLKRRAIVPRIFLRYSQDRTVPRARARLLLGRLVDHLLAVGAPDLGQTREFECFNARR